METNVSFLAELLL